MIEYNSNKLGGQPVFEGTRIPVSYLFEYIREGKSLRDFLRAYPSLEEEKVVGVINLYSKWVFKDMGMNAANYIVIGTRIPREEYQEEFGAPYFMDEKDNDLVAFGGAEKQWDEIIVGTLEESMDAAAGGMKAVEPTDLVSEYSRKKSEVREKLAEIGIEDREISIYLTGAVR